MLDDVPPYSMYDKIEIRDGRKEFEFYLGSISIWTPICEAFLTPETSEFENGSEKCIF